MRIRGGEGEGGGLSSMMARLGCGYYNGGSPLRESKRSLKTLLGAYLACG